jgi:hypothetical protein
LNKINYNNLKELDYSWYSSNIYFILLRILNIINKNLYIWIKEYLLLLPLSTILFPQAIPLISYKYLALYRPKCHTSSKLTIFFLLFSPTSPQMLLFRATSISRNLTPTSRHWSTVPHVKTHSTDTKLWRCGCSSEVIARQEKDRINDPWINFAPRINWYKETVVRRQGRRNRTLICFCVSWCISVLSVSRCLFLPSE